MSNGNIQYDEQYSNIGAGGGGVVAVNPETGEETWSGEIHTQPGGGGGGTAPGGEDNTITVPDLGVDAAQEAAATRAEEAQTALQGEYDAAAANQPQYVKPGDEALDTIEDSSAYRDTGTGSAVDTVAGQMDALLNQDSAYMQQAKLRAEEQAQQYGLLGSSMSVGAAHRAAIESALPIAQQDAQTASKFGLQQQAAENQIGQVEAETELGSALMLQRIALENQQKMLDNSFQIAMKGMDQQGQLALQDMQKQWDFVTNDANLRLDYALKEKLNTQAIDAEVASSVRESASSLIQNYQVSVETLLKDPDFLQLGSDAVRDTLNNMLNTTAASIQFMADSSGVDIDDYLDDFIENAEFTVNIPTSGDDDDDEDTEGD